MPSNIDVNSPAVGSRAISATIRALAATAKSEIEALQFSLSNLATLLESYVTSSSLATTLANYVTNSGLADSLLDYATVADKSTNVVTDQASNTKYPSVKSVYDWATGIFQTISQAAIQTFTSYKEAYSTPAISAGVLNIDCAASNTFVVNHDANITSLTFSNIPAGVVYSATLILKQDATGGRTFAAPGSFLWLSNGLAPSITTVANKRNVFTLFTYDSGAVWIVSLAGRDA